MPMNPHNSLVACLLTGGTLAVGIPDAQPDPSPALHAAPSTSATKDTRQPQGPSLPDQTGTDPTRLLLDMFEERVPTDNQAPKAHPAVQSLLLADYLSEDERRMIRIKHGLWEPADLTQPNDRAHAARIAGGITDPVFSNPETAPTLRADALRRRGACSAALETLADSQTLAAIAIRAQALFDLARFDDADNTVQTAVDLMLAEQIDDADELAQGVRALMIRARIRGSQRKNGGDFQTLKSIIERGRDDLDRLSWQIRLVEAELLVEKHNLEDAAEALQEVLALNPRCADAIAMLADLYVNSFAFDQAEALIAELRELAQPFGGINPEAERIEARMRLRQRDPDAALAVLAPARKSLPENRNLLAWHAAAEAASFDESQSAALLAELETISPGTPLGHYTAARVLSEARQYDESIAAFELASERLPNWSAPHIELGLVLIQAGRDAQARRVLDRAVELDPFNARARNSLELVRGLAEFATTEGDHFIIRHAPPGENAPALDAMLAREMLPVLEQIHDRVTADPTEIPGGIGHEPAQKTIIEIMPSHAWFSVRITGMTRIHTMAAATGPVIAMESPREGPEFTVGPFDWPRVLQHEYTHTVTLSKTHNRIPHWFTEATAVFCEDAPRDERTWQLLARAYETDTLFDLTDINTAFVRPKKPTDRGQAYAQGHWMVQFIVDRWGPETPNRLMDRYAAGEREDSAFEAQLGINAESFMAEFKQWAAADLRRVGLLPPEGVPTIPEMLDADRREAQDPDSIRPDQNFIERWHQQYPDHPQIAQLMMSRAMANTDPTSPRLPAQTLETITQFTVAVPIAETPHRILARHYLAGDESDRVKAIPHLEFLDAREQNSTTYAIELAELCAAEGDHTKSLRYAERATRIDPFDADAREFAARVAISAALASVPERRTTFFNSATRHIEALTIIEPTIEKHRQRLERVRALANR